MKLPKALEGRMFVATDGKHYLIGPSLDAMNERLLYREVKRSFFFGTAKKVYRQ